MPVQTLRHPLFALALAIGPVMAAAPPPAAQPPVTGQTPAASNSEPIADFLRDDIFEDVALSPTGQYLALSVNITEGGRTKRVLMVKDRASGKLLGHFNLAGITDVQGFWWVNDHRLLISAGEKSGLLEQPQPTGELYAMDADGSNQAILIGYRATTQQSGTHITVGKRTEADGASMMAAIPGDAEHVLVTMWPHDAGASGFAKAARLDVRSGQSTTVATAPVRNAQFVADRQGEVRFAIGSNEDTHSKTYYRDDGKSPWALLNDAAISKINLTPLGFDSDGHTAYLQREDAGNGADTLVAYDTASHTMKDVRRDAVADPMPVYGPQHALIGIRYDDAKPRFVFFDEHGSVAQAFRALENSFANQAVVPADFSADGKRMLVFVYSDRSPGDYYLFDLSSQKAVHLLTHREWIDPDGMGTQRAISFKARDGLDLHGFVTVPAGSNGKNLPLVVLPHGGPFGIEDHWGFDGEVQLLASRGYAVLQVNYRGSGGFGRQFTRDGYLQWGKAMQDDVTDATRWAIAQGIADPARVCIYGASYGAYAALMGVAKEPSLYRCAAGYVGVYDLPSLYHAGDGQSAKWGMNYLLETLGQDHLEAISPDRLVDRIGVPVLLAAGKEDERAPPIHTEMMRDALAKAGKSVQATIYPGEGHGFYLEADREAFYNSLLAFLDRNIGGGH